MGLVVKWGSQSNKGQRWIILLRSQPIYKNIFTFMRISIITCVVSCTSVGLYKLCTHFKSLRMAILGISAVMIIIMNNLVPKVA
jgi:magnesium-transporting ATPase (P-type)